MMKKISEVEIRTGSPWEDSPETGHLPCKLKDRWDERYSKQGLLGKSRKNPGPLMERGLSQQDLVRKA